MRRQTPEEEELNRKQAELAALQTDLIQKELDLATLQANLSLFEKRYLRIVGARYAELDAIEAEIARIFAALNPHSEEARRQASQARNQSRESAQATGSDQAARPEAEQVTEQQGWFNPSEDLRQLYRDVAKCVHPDLATNEAVRAQRTHLMAEANRAYQERDENRLRAILREWESSPEGVTGEGIGSELVRVIRRIAQVRERLRFIVIEIARLEESDLNRLKAKVDQTATEGRDRLDDMARTVDRQIAEARQRLADVMTGQQR